MLDKSLKNVYTIFWDGRRLLIMERLAMTELIKWKNSTKRKPLIVMGARQVGKTWLMKKFGENEYKKVAYISFYNNRRMAAVFDSDIDISRILMAFNIETNMNITPEDTLIILDEIQNAPKAIEALKYFCEEAPDYHVIAAGSLLGVAIHEGVSFPVGKVDIIHLHPMNYREFLYAVGEKALADAIITRDYSIIDAFSDKYIMWLKNYYYVGGMPEIVQFFSENRDYNEVRKMQEAIILQYRNDFGKHVSARELPRINMVWESIPMQLAKENRKFFFGQIKKGARSSEFEIAIEWLQDSGLVYKVNKVNEPHVPLAAYKDFSAYKIFMLDVGLLGALSGLDAGSILDGNDIFIEFKGALTEQYVHQQIISDTEYIPFYFGTDSATFEQDFLIQKGKDIVPIEVKAETNIRSQSLKAFSDKYHPAKSVRFSLMKHYDQGWIENIPLYAICNL